METLNRKPQIKTPRFIDVSRFTRMISNMDQRDRNLSPGKRKRKWFYILAGLFILYLLSFLFPGPQLGHQSMEPTGSLIPGKEDSVQTPSSQKPMTFEMPIDSFETLLKKQIDEKLSEKK